MGGQGLKTILYAKIYDLIFNRITKAILSQWIHSFIYLDYKYSKDFRDIYSFIIIINIKFVLNKEQN